MRKGILMKLVLFLAVVLSSVTFAGGSVSADNGGAGSSSSSEAVVYSALQNAVSEDAQNDYYNRSSYIKASADRQEALKKAVEYGEEVLAHKGSQQDVDVALEQINTCLNDLGGKPESLPHTGAAKTEGSRTMKSASGETDVDSSGKLNLKMVVWSVATLGALGVIACSVYEQLRTKRETKH